MPRYLETRNTGSIPTDMPIEDVLLRVASSKARILVLGPHLAMQQAPQEEQGTGDTSIYLRNLLKSMVEWCIQHNIINHPQTIETFHQLSKRDPLVHAGNMLEEYLVEKEQLQLCLAEVLQKNSVSQLYQKLVQLPFRAFISTTYDSILETTYEQVHQRTLPKLYTSSISNAVHAYQQEKQFILKLYGDIDNAESLVFGPRLNKGLSSIDERIKLSELLALSEVVFLGFEQNDPDLQYLTDLLQGSLQSYNLFTVSQLQTLTDKHHPNWHEGTNSTITVFEPHSSATNTAILPKDKTPAMTIASTGSYVRRTRPQERPSQTHVDQAQSIEIYTAYTQNDERFFTKIKELLEIFHKQGELISCHESEIIHSTVWKRGDYLDTANIILLLVSTTFLNSDFCYCKQMHAAVERHQTDSRCHVVPIILHPLHHLLLEKTPFGKLNFLPTTGKPISANSNKAYADISGYLSEKIRMMRYYI